MINRKSSYSTLILSYNIPLLTPVFRRLLTSRRIFAPMKTKILTLLLALLLCPLASNAQFNTISCHAPRARITAINEKEASPESDTSHVRLPGTLAPDSLLSQKQSERTSHVSMTYPLRNIKITSPFGYRTDPFTGKRTMHNGVDLAAHSAVAYSMFDGTVEKTGFDTRSGNFITLRHGDFRISYCHLSQILTTKGQSVLAGFPVGITGSTGRSTGEHLHITAKYKGKAFNPMTLLNILLSSSLATCATRPEDSVVP